MAPKPDPSSAELTAALVAMYILAEQRILSETTRILRHTVATDTGYVVLGQLRQMVRRILDGLHGGALASAVVAASVAEGRRDADRSVSTALAELPAPGRRGGSGGGNPPGSLAIPGDGEPFDLSMPHGERAAKAIRDDVVSSLEDVRFRLTRLPDDIYKFIAPHGGIYQVLDNVVSPAQAQAMAWRVFVSQGVTGFTDRSGRDWSLSAYTEMAVRTASARAFNASHLARMQALGIEYFTVPIAPHTCPKCFPWQGRVLTATTIDTPAIPVDATIAEATVAGLFHPNCRHQLQPVFPGVTVLPEPQVWTQEMQDDWELSQKQRRLELTIRKAKRQLEFATTPEARAESAAKVRSAQAKMRQFIAATGFARNTRREQTDLTDPRIKLTVPR